jgi:tetratricopeptide (TPR) repeat protein
VLPEPLAAAASDPLALADSVTALRRYSLIRVVADGLYIHSLLQMVIRMGLDSATERVWAASAVDLLDVGFPSESDAVANWPECQRLLPHVLAVVNHGRRLEVQSELCLRLLDQAAVYQKSRGQYQQALTLHTQVLDGRRQILGDDHPDTLRSVNSVAELRRKVGNIHGAHNLHEQVLDARKRVLGEDHPDTLHSMNELAGVRRALSDLQGSHDLVEEAFLTRHRVLGEDHPDTLWSMHGLATISRELGDLDGARQLYEKAIAARRRVLGEDHPDTLWSMHALATTRRELGDLQGARECRNTSLSLGNESWARITPTPCAR